MKLFLTLVAMLLCAFFAAGRLAEHEVDADKASSRIQGAALLMALLFSVLYLALFHVMDHPIDP